MKNSARVNRSLRPMQHSDQEGQLTDALSVDVEDYFHVEAFADRIPRSDWTRYPPRVRRNTQRILEIFDRRGCRATFFILGWVAKLDPVLVREIARAGHEVGCHSFAHRRVSTMKPEEFRDDLRRAREAIEDAAGVRVSGYRAPTFSIGRDNLWALEVLAEEGFLYDSSFFPIRHDLYGFPKAPRFAHRRELASGRCIIEIPLSTVRVCGMNLPVGGGGYLRLLPMAYTQWAIRRVHRQENQPVIVYLHPWELDAEQPRLEGKWRSRIRHYTGIQQMERRLEQLLAGGRFVPLIELVKHLDHTPLLSTSAVRDARN